MEFKLYKELRSWIVFSNKLETEQKQQQKQLEIQQKLIDYLVRIIADHVFWEKGEDNRCRNFKAKIEEIKKQ